VLDAWVKWYTLAAPQAAGGWPLGAYARAAPHPRGTVVAQDFFRSGLLPADTDFRVFAASLLRRAAALAASLLNSAAAIAASLLRRAAALARG
jgi:hypothetical protein